MLCAAGLFSYNESVKSDAYASVPAGTINNLYDDASGTFNVENLDKLAQSVLGSTAKYIDLENAAKNGTIKTATDFGSTTVKLGTYTTKSGSKQDLVWIPAYLSKDSSGNAILTLWLASTETTNTSSDQEVAMFTDGTCSWQSGGNAITGLSAAKSYVINGTTHSVYNANYDASYLRHYILNADTGYVENYGNAWRNLTTSATHHTISQSGGKLLEVKSDQSGFNEVNRPNITPTSSKFSTFTIGALSQYVVTPSSMTWQMAESGCKNDPAYTNSRAQYYTSQWVGDKVWIPSVSEVGDNTKLWKTTPAQRAGGTWTWTRSGDISSYSYDHTHMALNPSGTIISNPANTHPNYYYSVRPAIHFNISSLNIVDAPKVTGTYTYNGSAQTIAFDSNFDTAKMEITGIARTGGTA
ncbi:MAG: hypothetical protein K2L87_06115, partial [Clostridiales bacterium]|nr:hypothetical protein [Clostridiales bacterium]